MPESRTTGPIFCSNCGKRLRPRALFCTRCGKEIVQRPPIHTIQSLTGLPPQEKPAADPIPAEAPPKKRRPHPAVPRPPQPTAAKTPLLEEPFPPAMLLLEAPHEPPPAPPEDEDVPNG